MTDKFIRSPFSAKREIVLNLDKTVISKWPKNGLKELDVLVKWRKLINEMVYQIHSPNPKTFRGIPKKRRDMTADEDMARVNPYFREDRVFTINCAYCSAAYDLRRRDYDVEADYYSDFSIEPSIFEIYSWWTHKNSFTRSVGFSTNERQSALDKLYPGYKYFSMSENSIFEVEESILSQGNGARGQMSFMWIFGGAHQVVYEVSNNRVIIRDCQNNKVRKLKDYYGFIDRLYYFRTDNEEPTERILNTIKMKNLDTVNSDYKVSSASGLIRFFKNAGYRTRLNKVFLDNGSKGYLIVEEDLSVKYVNSILNERSL